MEETAGSKTWEATVECGCRIGGEPQGEAGEISRGFGATGVGVSTLHFILQEGATERRGIEPLLRGLAHTPVNPHLVVPTTVRDFCLFHQTIGCSVWNQLPLPRR